jgi:hypothetical protein
MNTRTIKSQWRDGLRIEISRVQISNEQKVFIIFFLIFFLQAMIILTMKNKLYYNEVNSECVQSQTFWKKKLNIFNYVISVENLFFSFLGIYKLYFIQFFTQRRGIHYKLLMADFRTKLFGKTQKKNLKCFSEKTQFSMA